MLKKEKKFVLSPSVSLSFRINSFGGFIYEVVITATAIFGTLFCFILVFVFLFYFANPALFVDSSRLGVVELLENGYMSEMIAQKHVFSACSSQSIIFVFICSIALNLASMICKLFSFVNS